MASEQCFEEEFTIFENKVEEVMEILNSMSATDSKLSEQGVASAEKFLGIANKEQSSDKADIENFLVKTNYDRTFINKTPDKQQPATQDAQSFMMSVEKDANRRAAERKQREALAQELRKMGNQAFRSGEYEKAVSMYSKAIDQVRDSPILYNNRALSFIHLSLHKRAIIDCDFVLNKLDEKNLRAWLYRAKAYYHLDDTRLYEKSISEAKKHHPKDIEYIEKIVSEIVGPEEAENVQDEEDEDGQSNT